MSDTLTINTDNYSTFTIREELLIDSFMTHIIITKDNKLVDDNIIAYTYKNTNRNFYEIVINENKIDNCVNSLYNNLCEEEHKTRPYYYLRVRLLLAIITHELGHIHNKHIYEKNTIVLRELEEVLKENKMTLKDLSFLGSPLTVVNIAEDLQINGSYLTQAQIHYLDLATISPWVAEKPIFKEYTNYIIKLKETRREYYQEIINLIKSIKNNNKMSSDDYSKLTNMINNMTTSTEKNNDISNIQNTDSDELKNEMLNNIMNPQKKEEDKQKKKRENKIQEELTKRGGGKNGYDLITKLQNELIEGNGTSSIEMKKQILEKIQNFIEKNILNTFSIGEIKLNKIKKHNRGLTPEGVYSSSLVPQIKKNTKKCLFILDTSGSMNLETIEGAIKSLKGRLEKKYNTIDIAFYTTQLEELVNIKDLKLKDYNGGTDILRGIIDYQNEYHTIIVYSDMETNFHRLNEIKTHHLYTIDTSRETSRENSINDYVKKNKKVLFLGDLYDNENY